MTRMASGEPEPVVCIDDPAIDFEATGDQTLRHYVETREFDLLKFHAGQKPTVFHVGRLTTSQVAKINRYTSSEDERNTLAFMGGVVRVEQVRTLDGAVREDWRPKYITSPKPKQHPQMTEAELDLFPIDWVQEIGSVAYQRAPLAPGRPVCFIAPDSSAVALARKERASLRAATLSPGTQGKETSSSASDQSKKSGGETPGAAPVPAP